MCGIYGMVSLTGEPLRHPELADGMAAALAHRGPDGRAEFRDSRYIIGCQRLRIIDLHERADQPFTDAPSRVTLACNGEIYNKQAIRTRFPDYPYQSHSDVESILPLYLADGMGALAQLDGMFGLAIWDDRTRELILARDRAGEKPLFYIEIDGELWFASEMQVLMLHPKLRRDLDREAIEQYLLLGYVLEPRTILANVRRIEAGSAIRFSGDRREPVRYWRPDAFPVEQMSPAAAERRLMELLENAVAKQLASDVPIGVFTSGGLDSSLLAAITAARLGPGRLRTFAVQFDEPSYDESDGAARLGKRLHAHFVAVPATEETLEEAMLAVTSRVAEPVSDPAILPSYLLAAEARKHVTVVLSGEGADELFGGYPTYLGHKACPYIQAMPGPLQGFVKARIEGLKPSTSKVSLEFLLKRFVGGYSRPLFERHILWFGTGLAPYLNLDVPRIAGQMAAMSERQADELADVMLLDYRSYLRDQLLVKVDRATMLSSIEARAPFLDRELSAFALSLPSSLRIRNWSNKWLLKRAGEKWIPPEITRQRKRGLSVPIAKMINRGLAAKVDGLLGGERLRDTLSLDPAPVQRLLREHREGRADHSRRLWPVIMLSAWLERWAN